MNRNCANVRLARVDLDRVGISLEDITPFGIRFLGGRGINHYLLLRELSKGTKPFDGANPVVFGTGLFVGTSCPGANRVNIACLSPLTGGLASASAGGGFSIELRSAGIDHLLITGIARKPVYIWIADDEIEVRDAAALVGKNTRETVRLIREATVDRNTQVACIGPAGEKLSFNSCVILTESRAAGRCGIGAILGSKHVKAIAVRGTGKIEVENEEFELLTKKMAEKVKNSSMLQKLGRHGTVIYGTLEGDPFREAAAKNFQNSEPVKRFRLSEFEQFHVGKIEEPCCPVGCAQQYRVLKGKYRGTNAEKFEGNSRGDFGERLGLKDAAAILRAHELCQLYGLDVDNTSGAIAWAFECYQRGLISRRDADGLELVWGNDEAVIRLIEKIGRRNGFGETLADGCKEAARKLGRGSDEFCIHIKGQALQEALRPYKGWALGVVVSERGGGHTRGSPLTEFGTVGVDSSQKTWTSEASRRVFGISESCDPTSYRNKAKLVFYYERFHSVLDSVGVCYFVSNWIEPNLLSPDDMAAMASTATGRNISATRLMKIGDTIVCLGKLFNQVHAGFERRDDYPPPRLTHEAVETGPFKDERLEIDAWDEMLDDYYRLHGWDSRSGCITHTALGDLGLEEFKHLLISVPRNE